LKITAHIAWASIEAQQRLIDLLSQNIVAFKQGEQLNRLD
jgi:glycerate dehydrogenase